MNCFDRVEKQTSGLPWFGRQIGNLPRAEVLHADGALPRIVEWLRRTVEKCRLTAISFLTDFIWLAGRNPLLQIWRQWRQQKERVMINKSQSGRSECARSPDASPQATSGNLRCDEFGVFSREFSKRSGPSAFAWWGRWGQPHSGWSFLPSWWSSWFRSQ